MKKFLLVVFSLLAAGIINAQTKDEQAIEVHFGAYEKSSGGGVTYIWGTRYGNHVFFGGTSGVGMGNFFYGHLGVCTRVYFSGDEAKPFIGLSLASLVQIKSNVNWDVAPMISPCIGIKDSSNSDYGFYASVSVDITGPLVTSVPPYKKLYFAPKINFGFSF